MLFRSGMKEPQMRVIADCIADAIEKGESAKQSVLARVKELTEKFPLYN